MNCCPVFLRLTPHLLSGRTLPYRLCALSAARAALYCNAADVSSIYLEVTHETLLLLLGRSLETHNPVPNV